jgi:predicted nuclease of predicted toxin-antitoxin system
MKVKLDENLGRRGTQVLRDAACDVSTVHDQQLCAVADITLIEVCRVEERILISLDTDFANVLRFRPSRYAGIVVLRLPEPLSLSTVDGALQRFLALASTRSPVTMQRSVNPLTKSVPSRR